MEISLDATRHFLCSSIKTNSSLLKNTISNPTQLRWKHFIKHRCHRRTHFSQSIEKFVYVNSFRVQFSEAHLKTRTIFGFSQCCLLFRKSWFIFAQIPIYDQTEKGLINGRLCKTYYGYKILGWWGWKDFWVNEFRRRSVRMRWDPKWTRSPAKLSINIFNDSHFYIFRHVESMFHERKLMAKYLKVFWKNISKQTLMMKH